MRRTLSAFWLCIAIAGSVRAVEPQKTVVIRKNASAASEAVFIAASALFTADGAFAREVPPHWRTQLEQTAKRSAEARQRIPTAALHDTVAQPCGGFYLGEADVESPVFRDTRETTIANAKAIFLGTIKHVVPGLFHGSPGSLLELGDLVHVKDGEAYSKVRDTLYVRHPHAHFRAGGIEYCRETQPGAYVPTSGDRVLVFAFTNPVDDAGITVHSFADDLVIQPASENPRVPRRLEVLGTTGRNISQIAADVQRAVASREGR